jgi:hypothetical protein
VTNSGIAVDSFRVKKWIWMAQDTVRCSGGARDERSGSLATAVSRNGQVSTRAVEKQ